MAHPVAYDEQSQPLGAFFWSKHDEDALGNKCKQNTERHGVFFDKN